MLLGFYRSYFSKNSSSLIAVESDTLMLSRPCILIAFDIEIGIIILCIRGILCSDINIFQ